VSGPLTARHFELYRLMLATARPGNGGRPVCSYGQAKLAARLDVSTRTVQQLVADLREPGLDPRHPDVKPAGLRLGWLLVLPRERPGARNGGTLYGGNRYVLQLDPNQVDQLEALYQASGHMPRSHRSEAPGEAVPAGRTEAKSASTSLSRYVCSTSGTGGGFPHPESGPAEPPDGAPPALLAESPLQPSRPTNNGRHAWIPREEYVRRKAREIAATDGVAKAEAYLAKCQATLQRQERMRAVGQAAAAAERETRELEGGSSNHFQAPPESLFAPPPGSWIERAMIEAEQAADRKRAPRLGTSRVAGTVPEISAPPQEGNQP
jgi:hypothetical protein